MREQQQNKRINQLRRQLTNVVERIKIFKLYIEPEGRISEAFTVLEGHIDSRFDLVDSHLERIDFRLDRMEHQFNQLQAKIEVILDAITGIADLPEDETESN